MNNEQLNNEEFRQAMANLENNQGVDEADARIIIDTFKAIAAMASKTEGK